MLLSKDDFRRKAAEISAGFAPGYIKVSNEAITQRVLKSREFLNAQTVFCYVSAGNEPDTSEIITAAFKAGKRVCVPKCEKNGIMTAREISSLKKLKAGKFGIKEPEKSSETVSSSEIDLCIAPCVCAGRDGARIGHGGGYYDRFFSDYAGRKILLCRKNLVFDSVLTEPFDIKCDKIITD